MCIQPRQESSYYGNELSRGGTKSLLTNGIFTEGYDDAILFHPIYFNS